MGCSFSQMIIKSISVIPTMFNNAETKSPKSSNCLQARSHDNHVFTRVNVVEASKLGVKIKHPLITAPQLTESTFRTWRGRKWKRESKWTRVVSRVKPERQAGFHVNGNPELPCKRVWALSAFLPIKDHKGMIAHQFREVGSVPASLMEDRSWHIIRFAGEESVTRGRSCMLTREGNSSSTEGLTALWWTEAERSTPPGDTTRAPPEAASDHLRHGCGFFGIDESQSIATQSSIILQDQSSLGGRPQLPGQQAEGQA